LTSSDVIFRFLFNEFVVVVTVVVCFSFVVGCPIDEDFIKLFMSKGEDSFEWSRGVKEEVGSAFAINCIDENVFVGFCKRLEIFGGTKILGSAALGFEGSIAMGTVVLSEGKGIANVGRDQRLSLGLKITSIQSTHNICRKSLVEAEEIVPVCPVELLETMVGAVAALGTVTTTALFFEWPFFVVVVVGRAAGAELMGTGSGDIGIARGTESKDVGFVGARICA
jgi:hypothetical protein